MTATCDLAFDRAPSLRDVFALVGDEIRTHKGRSVVEIAINGKTHYLKRYWLTASQLFQRHVARGFHELRMIDWLNGNGFAGPKVVARGFWRFGPVRTRLYFLMEKVEDECPLETVWHRLGGDQDALLSELASFAARLHDAGFVHTDFSQAHILVGQGDCGFTFRLIDLERAAIDGVSPRRAASDLKTLAASVGSDQLGAALASGFLDAYMQNRPALGDGAHFRQCYADARATRSF